MGNPRKGIKDNKNVPKSYAAVVKACVRYFVSSFYISPNDNPSKTMKNAFNFI